MKDILKKMGLVTGFIIGVGIVASLSGDEDYQNDIYDDYPDDGDDEEVGYGEAISAISHSNTDDFYKQNMIRLVAKNKDSDYYSAVIAIAYSDMDSFYKYTSLNNLK